jgi:hypothetical protein
MPGFKYDDDDLLASIKNHEPGYNFKYWAIMVKKIKLFYK